VPSPAIITRTTSSAEVARIPPPPKNNLESDRGECLMQGRALACSAPIRVAVVTSEGRTRVLMPLAHLLAVGNKRSWCTSYQEIQTVNHLDSDYALCATHSIRSVYGAYPVARAHPFSELRLKCKHETARRATFGHPYCNRRPFHLHAASQRVILG
jgi:hypothetical protein